MSKKTASDSAAQDVSLNKTRLADLIWKNAEILTGAFKPAGYRNEQPLRVYLPRQCEHADRRCWPIQYIAVYPQYNRRMGTQWPQQKTTTLNIRIEPNLKVALRTATDHEHRSIANMIEVMVRGYCARTGIAIPDQVTSLGADQKPATDRK